MSSNLVYQLNELYSTVDALKNVSAQSDGASIDKQIAGLALTSTALLMTKAMTGPIYNTLMM